MQNLPAATQAQPLLKPAALSTKGLTAATAILDTATVVGPGTRLLPVEVALAVIAAIDAEPEATDAREAKALCDALMVHYALDRVATPDEAKQMALQMTALCRVFAAYPPSFGRRVVDPVKGLPSRLKYRPKPADLVEALDAEKHRRALIRANAQSHMQERDRRLKQAEEDAEYAKIPIEQRRQMILRAFGRLPADKIDHPSEPHHSVNRPSDEGSP